MKRKRVYCFVFYEQIMFVMLNVPYNPVHLMYKNIVV